MLTFSRLIYDRLGYNKDCQKDGKKATVDTFVCELNAKKTGGFSCSAKIRVKYSKAVGDEFPVVVERAAAKHQHPCEDDDTSGRKYTPYTKLMDDLIEDGIMTGLAFPQIKKKLLQKFPDSANNFTGVHGVRRLYSKFHR